MTTGDITTSELVEPLGHTEHDRYHVMTTGDITTRELVEPLPSTVHECNIVFILQRFPSSNKTTAQDELLENGRTQEPSVRTAVFHDKDQTSDLLSTKHRKYLTLSYCNTLTQLYMGFNRVAVSSHEDGNGNHC